MVVKIFQCRLLKILPRVLNVKEMMTFEGFVTHFVTNGDNLPEMSNLLSGKKNNNKKKQQKKKKHFNMSSVENFTQSSKR